MFDADLASVLTTVGLAALGAYLAILLLKAVLSWRYASRHPETMIKEAPITVVQPILSGDAFLETALERNLTNAPSYATFLWLLDADDAEAWRIAEALRARWPGRIQLVACSPPAGNVNPKTCKLQQAMPHLETPYVAVLDDDTILEDAIPGKAMAVLDACDLYTGLPCYLPGVNVWSSLVTHFVNNNSIVTYLPLLNFLQPISINGMFYVMRTEKLRELGGFTAILDQLCDDYAMARLVKSKGGILRQGVTPLRLRTTVDGAGQYVRLLHRWFVFANVLANDQPVGTLMLLFLFLGLPPFLLWLSFLTLFGGWWALALPAGLLTRYAILRGLHRFVFGAGVRFSFFVSVASELLQPLHWMHASVQRRLMWRRRAILLGRDGRFAYVGDQP